MTMARSFAAVIGKAKLPVPKLSPAQRAAQTRAKNIAARREADAAAAATRSAAAGGGAAATAATRAAVAQATPRVPSGQPGAGQWTSQDFVQTLRRRGLPADDQPIHPMRIDGPSKERTFAGSRVDIPTPLVFGGPGKQFEVGDRAESLAFDYVRQKVSPTAAMLKEKGKRNNLPFDMIAHVPGRGIVLYEVKGGQPSNTPGGWQWRVTFDYKMTEEQKKKLGKMTEAQLRDYQRREAIKRKNKFVSEIDRTARAEGLLTGKEKVHVETVGVIFDANRSVTDVHVMDDVVERTGWTDERATAGYRGSFRFRIEKARAPAAVREWGDALEADLMAQLPEIMRMVRRLTRPHDAPVAAITIAKVAPERRYFAGWASIIEKNGQPVVDTQNHVIDEPTLIAAADEFMRSYRVGKVLHRGEADKVEYTESVVFTRHVQKVLGVDLGKVGWWVGGYARDDATWAAIKDGRLKSLSIGGKARIVDAD